MNIKTKDLILNIILALLILIAASLLITQAISNYHSFNTHQREIRAPSPTIQAWMSPETILRHFNISSQKLLETLNISETNTYLRTPLSQICLKQKINCTEIIAKLNNQSS